MSVYEQTMIGEQSIKSIWLFWVNNDMPFLRTFYKDLDEKTRYQISSALGLGLRQIYLGYGVIWKMSVGHF